MSKARSADFLVAEFAKFPGLRIPLLSDEECAARGIEKPSLPPFETWTPEQQEAGRRLGEILATMAVRQACKLMLAQIEQLQADGYRTTSESELQKEAARRGIAMIDRGEWRADRSEVSGLQSEMRTALESFAKG